MINISFTLWVWSSFAIKSIGRNRAHNYGCNVYILQLHKTRTEEDMIMLTVVSDTPSQCSTSTVKFQVEVHVTLTDWDWHDML